MSILENKVHTIAVLKHHLTKEDSVNKVKAVVNEVIESHKTITIYYHGNCNDGLASVYMMREHVKKLTGVVPRTVAVQYSKSYEMFDDTDLVIFVDFCPTLKECSNFINSGVAMLVIDHHKTAIDNVIKNINSEIKSIIKPALFIISEDNSASAAELTYLFTDNTTHFDTVDAIGRYDRFDKSHAWHQSQALATLLKSRMPTVPMDMKIDVMGEYLTRPPEVIFGMAIKFFAHHKSVVVALAANAFNNGLVLNNAQGERKALLFTSDKTMGSDVADLLLESEKNLQVVCAVCIVHGRFEISFRSRQERPGPQAIDFAQTLGGGGHVQAAGYVCDFANFNNVIAVVKKLLNI